MCTKSQSVLSTAVAIICLSYNIELVEAFSSASVPTFHTKAMIVRNGGSMLFQGQSSIMEQTSNTKEYNSIVPAIDKRQIIHTMSPPNQKDNTPFVKPVSKTDEESVPSTWTEALQRFFIGEIGPPLVIVTISGFLYTRLQLPIPFSLTEAVIFASSIIFWWLQEYFLHRTLLHSPVNWIGKSIHQSHHERNYFHVSIDPPALLLGWLFTAHFMLKAVLPWNLCLSATIGYAMAGLVYEWSHYIVHTKVKPSALLSRSDNPLTQILARLFSQMRNNHIQHHLLDDQYWFAFSVPAMDELFGTNPNVKDVRAGYNKRER